jgi:hypothetical protein
MVINDKNRFIFVHIPKAAGTSVMKTLQEINGNNKKWLAKTKHETLAGFNANISDRFSLKDRILSRSPKGYFTFGFVRNPWDRMSSFYRFLVEKRPMPEIDTVENFKDFLRQAEDGVEWIQELYSMKPQLEYFTLADGRLKIDFLGHFEHLTEDFNSVTDMLGLSAVSLVHQNRSTNSDKDYRKSYDDEMVEIVSKRFSEEIVLFGYDYENKNPTRRCSERLSRRR